MKQKNIILVAVAVGCGLVAAFLTTQLGAGQKKVEEIEIPVAANDLTVGTRINKEELKNFVSYKKFPKEAVPALYVATEEELQDKRLMRTIRKGEPFNPQDLTAHNVTPTPPGMSMITFGASMEKAVAGFAGPGSKVDVLAAIPMTSKGGKAIVIPILTDMLVLAIDTNTSPAQGQQAFASLSTVSLAVTTGQAAILHGAIHRGADLRLLLRNSDSKSQAVWPKVYTEEEIWQILADEADKKPAGTTTETPEPAKATTVKLPVPTESLPAGTKLTAELIDTKFKFVEFVPPAPANIVASLKEHTGKFLTNKLEPNQFVPNSFLSESAPEEPKTTVAQKDPEPKYGKPAPTAGEPSISKEKVELPEAPKPKPPVYVHQTIQTSSGYKKYRYQKLENGEFKFIGEVKDEPGSAAEEKKSDAEEKKPEADEKKPETNKKGGTI